MSEFIISVLVIIFVFYFLGQLPFEERQEFRDLITVLFGR